MTVQFNSLPTSLAEFQAMTSEGYTNPERVAGLFLCALDLYAQNAKDGIDAINLLKGPQPLSPTEVSWFRDRMSDKKYLPRAYFEGSTPENNYTPTTPYTLVFSPDPRVQDTEAGYIRLYIKTPAFDNPRYVKLRQKGNDWFIWEVNSIMLGVKMRKQDDAWA